MHNLSIQIVIKTCYIRFDWSRTPLCAWTFGDSCGSGLRVAPDPLFRTPEDRSYRSMMVHDGPWLLFETVQRTSPFKRLSRSFQSKFVLATRCSGSHSMPARFMTKLKQFFVMARECFPPSIQITAAQIFLAYWWLVTQGRTGRWL